MTDPDPDTRRPVQDRGAAWLARQRQDPEMAAAMDEAHARNTGWEREWEQVR